VSRGDVTNAIGLFYSMFFVTILNLKAIINHGQDDPERRWRVVTINEHDVNVVELIYTRCITFRTIVKYKHRARPKRIRRPFYRFTVLRFWNKRTGKSKNALDKSADLEIQFAAGTRRVSRRSRTIFYFGLDSNRN